MARTKATARPSTGGKTPRKELGSTKKRSNAKAKKASPKKASPKKASPKKASSKKASSKKASSKKASPKKRSPVKKEKHHPSIKDTVIKRIIKNIAVRPKRIASDIYDDVRVHLNKELHALTKQIIHVVDRSKLKTITGEAVNSVLSTRVSQLRDENIIPLKTIKDLVQLHTSLRISKDALVLIKNYIQFYTSEIAAYAIRMHTDDSKTLTRTMVHEGAKKLESDIMDRYGRYGSPARVPRKRRGPRKAAPIPSDEAETIPI